MFIEFIADLSIKLMEVGRGFKKLVACFFTIQFIVKLSYNISQV